MEQDRYNKLLYKLFLKGIIDEKTLEEKMEERKNTTEFENNVNRAILEVIEDGYVRKAMERISKERFNK